MEIAIAAFIGCWLSFFAVWGYRKIKKDFSEVQTTKQGHKGEPLER